VGWNDQAAARYLRADQLGRELLAPRDKLHLAGDDAQPRVVHLRADFIVAALSNPLGTNHKIFRRAGVYGTSERRPRLRCAASTSYSFSASWFLSCLGPETLPYSDSPFDFKLYSRYTRRGTHIDALDPEARSERYLLARHSRVLANMEESRTASQIQVASGTHKLCTQACRLNHAS